jgi:hypothetical protein
MCRQEATGPRGQDVGRGHCQADGHGPTRGGTGQVGGNRQVSIAKLMAMVPLEKAQGKSEGTDRYPLPS